jgi:hypothetical protein
MGLEALTDLVDLKPPLVDVDADNLRRLPRMDNMQISSFRVGHSASSYLRLKLNFMQTHLVANGGDLPCCIALKELVKLRVSWTNRFGLLQQLCPQS